MRALDHNISAWSAGNAYAGPCANIRRAQWRMDTYVCECALCCGSVLYAVRYLIHTCTCAIWHFFTASALDAPLGAEQGIHQGLTGGWSFNGMCHSPDLHQCVPPRLFDPSVPSGLFDPMRSINSMSVRSIAWLCSVLVCANCIIRVICVVARFWCIWNNCC